MRHYKRFLNDCGMGVCTDDVELSIRRILQRVSERHSLGCARSCLEKTVDYFKVGQPRAILEEHVSRWLTTEMGPLKRE